MDKTRSLKPKARWSEVELQALFKSGRTRKDAAAFPRDLPLDGKILNAKDGRRTGRTWNGSKALKSRMALNGR